MKITRRDLFKRLGIGAALATLGGVVAALPRAKIGIPYHAFWPDTTPDRKFYVADWYVDTASIPDDVEEQAEVAFERAENYHGIKLGPMRRDHAEEQKMLTTEPRPALFNRRVRPEACRVYAADVVG